MQDHTYGNFENSRLERVFKNSKRLMGAEPAHDFEHVMRVYKNVEFLCGAENLNSELILAASLLHDIILYPKTGKNAKNSAKESADAAKTILEKIGYSNCLSLFFPHIQTLKNLKRYPRTYGTAVPKRPKKYLPVRTMRLKNGTNVILTMAEFPAASLQGILS